MRVLICRGTDVSCRAMSRTKRKLRQPFFRQKKIYEFQIVCDEKKGKKKLKKHGTITTQGGDMEAFSVTHAKSVNLLLLFLFFIF